MVEKARKWWDKITWSQTRNVLLFCLGAFILIWEVVAAPAPQGLIVGVALTMMGVSGVGILGKRFSKDENGKG